MERIPKEDQVPVTGQEEKDADQLGVPLEGKQNPVEELDQAQDGGAVAVREEIGGNPLDEDVSERETIGTFFFLSFVSVYKCTLTFIF